MTTKKGKSSLFSLFFLWVKLEFGIRGNAGLLISNLHSETQYQFERLKDIALFFSLIMIFSAALPHKLVTMATMNDLSSII